MKSVKESCEKHLKLMKSIRNLMRIVWKLVKKFIGRFVYDPWRQHDTCCQITTLRERVLIPHAPTHF